MDERAGSVVLALLWAAATWLPLASSQTAAGCSFGVSGDEVSTCELQVNGSRFSQASWRTGTGATANYLGGPKTDAEDSNSGGYGLAIVTDMLSKKAWLLTNVATATQPKGQCLEFSYSVGGLGVRSLEVLLLTYTSQNVQAALDNSTLPLTYHTRLLWQHQTTAKGEWQRAHVTFSTMDTHSLVFSASSKTQLTHHRSYAAVDDITFKDDPCEDDCMFDVDLCTWSNTETDDEFDWELSRSSGKRGTGPSRDQASFFNSRIITGGYANIDSGPPRRPNDRARLVSRLMQPLTTQHCLRFWINMNGGGLGTLRVLYQARDSNESIILWRLWETTTSGTDTWNQCQQTVASNEEFQLLFEASVRVPGAGDISIDTITLDEGSCPSLPSGLRSSWADCTFLVDSCRWTIEPPNGYSLSRVPSNSNNPPGHTQSVYKITDMYMKFDLKYFKCQARTSEALVSPSTALATDHCLSFWVLMYTTIVSLTHIGALKVVLMYPDRNVTVWHLMNQQHADWTYAQVTLPASTSNVSVALEGVQGPHVMGMIGVDDIAVSPVACQLKPEFAKVEAGDCTFDSGLCSWTVQDANDLTPSTSSLALWHLAQNNALKDHTFDADNGGYVYMETFNSVSNSNLTSPVLPNNATFCFTFWFSPVYDDNAQLTVSRVPEVGGQEELLWRFTHQIGVQINPEWMYGQLALHTTTADYQVVVTGKVTRSGWALDDFRFSTTNIDNCRVQPESAQP